MPNLSEILYYTGEISTQLIAWSLFAGIVIATIAGYLIKSKFGTFVRKLLENEIDSPEKAVTLDELGLKKKFFIKFGLRSPGNYKNMIVAITEDGKFYANNAYTDQIPVFKEFTIIKKQRRSDKIKESKNQKTKENNENADVELSGLAKVMQAKEKAANEKTTHESINKTVSEELSIEKNQLNDNSRSTKIVTAALNTVSDQNYIKESNNDTKTNENDKKTENLESDFEKTTSKDIGKTKFEMQKQRVKFDIKKARYYIPREIHGRAYSLYHATSKKNTIVPIIIFLIILALIVTFSGNLISGFTEFIEDIGSGFEKPII